MTTLVPVAVSPLRQRLIDEMEIRRFGREMQRNYIRDVGRLATFLGRSPDTATAEDVRRFQIEQGELDVPAPTMNAIVSALRFAPPAVRYRLQLDLSVRSTSHRSGKGNSEAARRRHEARHLQRRYTALRWDCR